MSEEIESYHTDVRRHAYSGEVVNEPIYIDAVYALVFDFTEMTADELDTISMITGGGSRIIVKCDASEYPPDMSEAECNLKIRPTLNRYRYEVVQLIMPWGFPAFEPVLNALYIERKAGVFIAVQIGRRVHDMGMSMHLDVQPGALDAGDDTGEHYLDA